MTRNRMGCILAGAVMLLIGIAAVGKLLDLGEFRRQLAAWPLPTSVLTPVAIALPVVEAGLVIMWCSVAWRRHAAHACLGLLGAFTVALAAMLIAGRAPTCACFALIERFYAAVSDARWAIVRNTGMMGGLVTALCLQRGSLGVPQATRAPAPATPRAFTLLETVLCVAIIGILVSLLAPSLSRFRTEARRTKTLASIGECGRVMTQYTNDWRDAFPAFMDPLATSTVLRLHDGRAEVVPGYFTGFFSWNWALADSYFNGNPFSPSLYDAEAMAQFGPGGGPSFVYPCAFFAAPEFWNPSTRTGAQQFRGVRQSDVMFPSSKSLLVDYYPMWGGWHQGVRVPISFVDGSSRPFGLSSITPGYEFGDGTFAPPISHYQDDWAALHTIDGVRGRDIR